MASFDPVAVEKRIRFPHPDLYVNLYLCFTVWGPRFITESE